MVSFQEVELVKKAFEREDEPYWDYIATCGISQVGIKDKNATAAEKDDFCISIGLRCLLPPDIKLPNEYRGVKVLAQVVGEAVAQGA